MERNSKNYLSLEYLKGILLAIHTFIYMFFYTIFYPTNNRVHNETTNGGRSGIRRYPRRLFLGNFGQRFRNSGG